MALNFIACLGLVFWTPENAFYSILLEISYYSDNCGSEGLTFVYFFSPTFFSVFLAGVVIEGAETVAGGTVLDSILLLSWEGVAFAYILLFTWVISKV